MADRVLRLFIAAMVGVAVSVALVACGGGGDDSSSASSDELAQALKDNNVPAPIADCLAPKLSDSLSEDEIHTLTTASSGGQVPQDVQQAIASATVECASQNLPSGATSTTSIPTEGETPSVPTTTTTGG